MRAPGLAIIALAALTALTAKAQNPYLPLWEFIPDGEPYVFEDPDRPGHQRVYIYGSHDTLIEQYCGKDQVVWSVPVEDLTDWRYDGVIFASIYNANGELLHQDGSGDVLYAPDVAERVKPDGSKEYFLYPNNQAGGRNGMVARSDRPDGPFTVINWNRENPNRTDGVLGFDPAVFVDDDGRVYGYWGFKKSYGAELDPNTMATVKPGTEIVEGVINGAVPNFYEASSIRKIEDKYVLVFSRYTLEGEAGLPSVNYTLAYSYSDSPLGPYTYGGTIIDARGKDVDDEGKPVATAFPYGNTHGGIQFAGGRWWVFYHRQTGGSEYNRQAMVAPITVQVQKGKGGRVTITEGEVTSEGFQTDGLDPTRKTPAGIACFFPNPKGVTKDYPKYYFTGSYVQPTRREDASIYQGPFNQKESYCPVVNNTAGSIVGFKYFNVNEIAKARSVSLRLHIVPDGTPGTVTVMMGGQSEKRGGKVIGKFQVSASAMQTLTEVDVPLEGLKQFKGKQPLFFIFSSDTEDKSICQLHDLQFVIRKK